MTLLASDWSQRHLGVKVRSEAGLTSGPVRSATTGTSSVHRGDTTLNLGSSLASGDFPSAFTCSPLPLKCSADWESERSDAASIVIALVSEKVT